jgi:hypothetical protein
MDEINDMTVAESIDNIADRTADDHADTELDPRAIVRELIAVEQQCPNANHDRGEGEKMGNALEHSEGHPIVFDERQAKPRAE